MTTHPRKDATMAEDTQDLPQWAIDQIAKEQSKRRHPAGKKRGLITVIPNGVEPEAWAARQGLV